MTKERELLTLALEALEDFKKLFVKIQELGMYYGASSKDARIGEVLIHDRAIADIKAALAQPKQEPVAFDAFLNSKDFYELMQTYRHFQIDAFKQFEAVKDALRAAHNTGAK